MSSDPNLTSLISSMLPELTEHVLEQQRQQYQIQLQKDIEQKRREIRKNLQSKIQEAASSISRNSDERLQEKRRQIMEKRKQLQAVQSGKVEVEISKIEKQIFIEDTIREIANSKIAHQIRQIITKKLTKQLTQQYEEKLEKQLECVRKDLQAAYNERKQAKRQYYQQSQQKLVTQKVQKLQAQLANCQEQKKVAFGKLAKEKAERDALKDEYEKMADKYQNSIAEIKAKIKACEENICRN